MVYYFFRLSAKGQGMVQLRIQYTQIADQGVEYTLQATIEQTTSQPDALDNCLVVKKGDSGADEELMRVGSYSEVVDTPKSPLPSTVNLFSSPSLALITEPGGIAIDDIIVVASPFIWRQHFSALAEFITVVDSVVSPTLVTVTIPFPAFGRNLVFHIVRGVDTILPTTPGTPAGYPVDGLANRDYTGLGVETEFLANDQASSWTDIDVAEGRYTQMQISAQTLVNAMKEDNYTSQSDEVYS